MACGDCSRCELHFRAAPPGARGNRGVPLVSDVTSLLVLAHRRQLHEWVTSTRNTLPTGRPCASLPVTRRLTTAKTRHSSPAAAPLTRSCPAVSSAGSRSRPGGRRVPRGPGAGRRPRPLQPGGIVHCDRGHEGRRSGRTSTPRPAVSSNHRAESGQRGSRCPECTFCAMHSACSVWSSSPPGGCKAGRSRSS